MYRRDDEEGREDVTWLDVFSVFSFFLSDHISTSEICFQTAFCHHRDFSIRHLKQTWRKCSQHDKTLAFIVTML